MRGPRLADRSSQAIDGLHEPPVVTGGTVVGVVVGVGVSVVVGGALGAVVGCDVGGTTGDGSAAGEEPPELGLLIPLAEDAEVPVAGAIPPPEAGVEPPLAPVAACSAARAASAARSAAIFTRSESMTAERGVREGVLTLGVTPCLAHVREAAQSARVAIATPSIESERRLALRRSVTVTATLVTSAVI
jgi:hypothetical protein